MIKETKVYLNTVEEFTKALKDNKIVYAMDEFCDGESKLEIINDMLVRKDPDGEILIDGTIYFKENIFYIKEKEPLKIEVGKFYKTRNGKKVICVFKDACNKQPFLFSEIGGECVNSFWTGEDGSYYYKSKTESKEDIVNYWED